jgi:curved DNA-binding protein CbpA
VARTDTFVDYYKVFGLERHASAEEIRRSYLKLAKRFHPDTGGTDEHMRLVNEAYAALQGEARRTYDRRYNAHYAAQYSVTDSRGAEDYVRRTYAAPAGGRAHRANQSYGRSSIGLAKLAFMLAVATVIVFFGASLAGAIKQSPASAAAPAAADSTTSPDSLGNIKVPEYVPSTDTSTGASSTTNSPQDSPPSPDTDASVGRSGAAATPAPTTTTGSGSSTTSQIPSVRYRCHRPLLTEDGGYQHIECPMAAY